MLSDYRISSATCKLCLAGPICTADALPEAGFAPNSINSIATPDTAIRKRRDDGCTGVMSLPDREILSSR